MGRQGPEQEAAVNGAVPVDLFNFLLDRLLAHILRQQAHSYLDAYPFRPLQGAALIGQVISLLPDPDKGQRRDKTAFKQAVDTGCQLSCYLVGDVFSEQNIRHLFSPALTEIDPCGLSILARKSAAPSGRRLRGQSGGFPLYS
jgi:hypothetical protein